MPKVNNLKKLFVISSSIFISSFVISFAGTTAPVTTLSKDPSVPDGNFGWYVSPVEITLNATDLESGVKEINYRLNSDPWQKVEFADTLNLAPNPSFEIADVHSDIYTSAWESNGLSEFVTFSRDTTEFPTGFGTVSVKIISTDSNWHAINNLNNFSVTTPYNNMNASVWVKSLDITSQVYFNIYAVSQDLVGQPVYTLISTSPVLTGPTTWTQLSSTFAVNVDGAMGVYMEVGTDTPGTVWVDAANISDSLINTSTAFTIGADGEHTFSYYSVDRAGNIETTKSTNIDIDQTPPGNWHNSGAFRGFFGSNYQLWVYTNVEDETSGLSTFTDKYQISTEEETGWGRFSNILSCGSSWEENNWVILITPPFWPGSKSAYLLTPKTSFCNDNWNICKGVRFYAEDLAGNTAMKDFCINGPWIKIRGGGIVGAHFGIDMLSEADGDNTDGLMEVGNNQIDFFSSSEDWNMTFSDSLTTVSYSTLWDNTKSKSELGSSLNTNNGVYYTTGNFTVDSGTIPSGYDTGNFNQIVFIDGDLTINTNLEIADQSTVYFIVNGDVNIEKTVENVACGIFAENNIYTAYNIEEGDSTESLVLKGIYSADDFVFQRTLQGTDNNDIASEDITFEPKYSLKLRDYIGTNAVNWISEE